MNYQPSQLSREKPNSKGYLGTPLHTKSNFCAKTIRMIAVEWRMTKASKFLNREPTAHAWNSNEMGLTVRYRSATSSRARSGLTRAVGPGLIGPRQVGGADRKINQRWDHQKKTKNKNHSLISSFILKEISESEKSMRRIFDTKWYNQLKKWGGNTPKYRGIIYCKSH